MKERNFSGSLARIFKNPFLCLWIFGTVIFVYLESPSPLIKQGDLFFKNEHFTLNSSQSLFLEQKNTAFLATFEALVINKNTFKESSSTTTFEAKTLAVLSPSEIERKEIGEYVVEEGETLLSIAEKFSISLNTILWANDLTNSSLISSGQKLTILPVNGLTHLVAKGETLSELAKLYQADVDAIININEISLDGDIFAGDVLIIPGGKKPVQKVVSYSAPLASSYFIVPVPSPFKVTQGLHWYNAIDFANGGCGSSVFAAAGGEIQRTGYNGTAGNYVRILHPNGIVTFYGHLSKILVSPGQNVSQGETIGYLGNTGYTVGVTGCHVHFEVRGARNPFVY